MIITFGNQKGGVGKTTLAIAFANYIKQNSDKNISVLDFDFQNSFFKQFEEDKKAGLTPLYEVEKIGKENFKFTQDTAILQQLKESADIFLFDTAGNINGDYAQLLLYSDVIIIPYQYSPNDMRSTVTFVGALLEVLNVKSKLLFVMNNMRKDDNYTLKSLMESDFERVGTVIKNPVYTTKRLLNVKTSGLNYEQKSAVKECFDELIFNIWES